MKESGVDEQVFNAAVLKRGKDLLENFYNVGSKDFKSFFEQARAYHEDVVAWGACFKAATKDRHISPDDLREIFTDVDIEVIRAGGLAERGEEGEITFLRPDVFGEQDYQMVVENLRRTYEDIDPGWLAYLKNNILNDLNNPDVKFVLVRDRSHENRLVGLCKIKEDPEEKGAYYFGTHYVEPEYQRAFGVGGYLQSVAESLVPEGTQMNATVAVSNTAMERHIEHAEGVGRAIVYEADEDHSSKELMKFSWHYPGNFKSKSFSQEQIRSRLGVSNFPEDNIAAYCLDTSPDNNIDFLKIAQMKFDEGYVLTRVFYDRESGKQNLKKTWLVFEKPTEVSLSQQPQQRAA